MPPPPSPLLPNATSAPSTTPTTATPTTTTPTSVSPTSVSPSSTPTTAEPTSLADSLPPGDAIFRAAYLANTEGDLIKSTQKECAVMRTEPSMSTSCIPLSPQGGGTAVFFPVSVCCTFDFCMMIDGRITAEYLVHTDGAHYLMINDAAVAVLPSPSSTVKECEDATRLATDMHSRYFPLLADTTLDRACAAQSDAPLGEQLISTPTATDEVFKLAASGLTSHNALVVSTHAWCAVMRTTRSIATACLRMPATPSSMGRPRDFKYVAVSFCCSQDLCEMRDTAPVAKYSYSDLDGEYFLLKEGVTVQAILPPSTTAAECEAVARVDADSVHPYPLLNTKQVDAICPAPPSPPMPPPSSPSTKLASKSSPSSDIGAGMLAGICIGGLVGAALLAVGSITCYRRRLSVSSAKELPAKEPAQIKKLEKNAV